MNANEPPGELDRLIVAFLHGLGRPATAEQVAGHLCQREDYVSGRLDDLRRTHHVAREWYGGWVATGLWNPSRLEDGRLDASEHPAAQSRL